MEFSKKFKFHAAHRLLNDDSKCHSLHGHEYHLKVGVVGKKPASRPFLVDAQIIKQAVEAIIEPLDHATLLYQADTVLIDFFKHHHQKIKIFDGETTSEYLVEYVAEKVRQALGATLKNQGITAIKVRLQETSTLEARVKLAL